MSILDTIFGRQQAYGHWVWAGIQQQLHTRSLPQVGCRVCEAEGWIPAMSACQEAPATESAPDDTRCYLALAREDTQHAIRHMATMDTDTFARQVALDALRDALTAIEAEMGVFDAQE